MVFEHISAGFRNSVKLMIGQSFAEKFAGSPASAFELVVGVGHAVGLEDGFQAAFVKGTVVCDKCKPFNFWRDLFPYIRENRSIVGVAVPKSVYLLAIP